MARSRFRSQPALQRSGGGASTTLLGVCLLLLTAAGAGALVSLGIRGLDNWANAPAAAPRVDRLAKIAPAPAEAAPAPQVVEAAAPTPQLASMSAKPHLTARTPKPAKPLKPLLADFGAREPRYERRQEEYKLAKDAYDANERAEGYRWAQQYRVRARRYCRDLERQRTAAFMEGCLEYAAGTKPRGTPGATQGDPG